MEDVIPDRFDIRHKVEGLLLELGSFLCKETIKESAKRPTSPPTVGVQGCVH
jgi:hypothetical protein